MSTKERIAEIIEQWLCKDRNIDETIEDFYVNGSKELAGILIKEGLEFADVLKQCVAIEPEFPGSMPDDIWDMLNGDRCATEEGLRLAVIMTKQGILDRLDRCLATGIVSEE